MIESKVSMAEDIKEKSVNEHTGKEILTAYLKRLTLILIPRRQHVIFCQASASRVDENLRIFGVDVY